MGSCRKGIVRVSGFKVSPVYATVDLNSTSAQNTTASAVALTAGTSGAGASVRLFSQQNGRIPVASDLRAAIGAKLDDDILYD